MVHNSTRGVAHFSCPSEPDCIRMIRQLMSYIPSNNLEDPPRITPADSPARAEEALNTIIPDNPNKPYDMKDVIKLIVDDGDFFEVQEYYAKNIVVGFARLNGRPVGIVGQQPNALAGVLLLHSSAKGAPFLRFCPCFQIPHSTVL